MASYTSKRRVKIGSDRILGRVEEKGWLDKHQREDRELGRTEFRGVEEKGWLGKHQRED